MYSVQYFGIFILFYFGIPAITMNNSGSNEIEDTKDFDKEWFDVLQNQLNIVSIRFEPMVAVLMKHNPSGVKTAINWLPGKKDLPFIRQLANKSTPMHKIYKSYVKLDRDLQKFTVIMNQIIHNPHVPKEFKKTLELLMLYHKALVVEVEDAVADNPDNTDYNKQKIHRLYKKHFHPSNQKDFVNQSTIILRQYKKYIETWLQVFNAHAENK